MEIEYIENEHKYVIDGVIVPSVSELVSYATGNIYKDVPEFILEQARTYGTNVHNAIEEYERTGTVSEEYQKQIAQYVGLKEEYILNVKEMEQMIHYGNHYCGRYDILDVEGNLWDIKTTSKFHQENLEWQLGLYYLALGKDSKVGYCIHIPKKGKPKVHLINPKSNQECKELIKTYEQADKSAED